MKPAEFLKKPYLRQVVPEDDGSFRAEIAEFPGCVALGDTPGEAYSNLEEVAEAWLESELARGQAIPQPMEEIGFSGKLVVRMPKSLHRKAALAAKRDDISLNQFIVGCISEQVGIRSAVSSVFVSSPFHVLTNALQKIPTGQWHLALGDHFYERQELTAITQSMVLTHGRS